MKLQESKKQDPDWAKSDDTTNVSILEVIPSNASVTPIQRNQPNRVEQEHQTPRWERIRQTIRQPLAEFFGVFTLIIFGDGVVAQVVLSKGQKGDYQSINWG
jgi:aquaglyceroporin related protein